MTLASSSVCDCCGHHMIGWIHYRSLIGFGVMILGIIGLGYAITHLDARTVVVNEPVLKPTTGKYQDYYVEHTTVNEGSQLFAGISFVVIVLGAIRWAHKFLTFDELIQD